METSKFLQFDITILGGGVIGLACAYEISKQKPNLKILLIEQHSRFGTETSSRNSEVIHAGIYYSSGSLKEELCIEGKSLLYSFCDQYSIPYRQCGKMIVGSKNTDQPYLEKLFHQANKNGVPLSILSQSDISKLEPQIRGEIGLFSPTTGILSSEIYTQTLAQLSETQGVTLATNSLLVDWDQVGQTYRLEIREPQGHSFQVQTHWIVNASGLNSFHLSKKIFGRAPPFSLQFVRGHYFQLKNRLKNVTSHLVYPMPDLRGGGLGIHLTLDLEGNARLGPDTDWNFPDKPNYHFIPEQVDSLRNKFFQAAQSYLPGLKLGDLSPGFIGIRPKRVGIDGAPLDFYICHENERGYTGWINLIGIESPGLTSSLAIARKVSKLI